MKKERREKRMRARNRIKEEVNKGQKVGEEGYGREKEEGRTEAGRGREEAAGGEILWTKDLRTSVATAYDHAVTHIHWCSYTYRFVLFFLYSICFINYYHYHFIIHTHASINQTLT